MKLFGLAGWSGSGKTTLMTRLLEELCRRGLRVSTIKHAHHGFDIDQPGKDSHRHRAAGAHEVLVSSARRWALMHELGDGPEASLGELVARLAPVDLLLIEGFKREAHAKLVVHRAANPAPLLSVDDPDIVAIASDEPVNGIDIPRFDLDDITGIADFIIDHCGLNAVPEQAGHGATE